MKIGDPVRILKLKFAGPEKCVGKTGIVLDEPVSMFVDVKLDDTGEIFYFSQDELELVIK